MDQAEPDVRYDLVGLAIVLDEGIQEHLGIETIIHANTNQVGCKGPLGKIDIIPFIIDTGGEAVVGANFKIHSESGALATVEISPQPFEVARDELAAVGGIPDF